MCVCTLSESPTSSKCERLIGKGINDVVKRVAERAKVLSHTFTGRGDSDDVSADTLRYSVALNLHAYDSYTLYNVRNRLRHSRLSTTEQKYDHFDSV
jgi:hypothetical protein